MASYNIEWKQSAFKELKKLPKAVILKILEAIESLRAIPRPSGVRKLTGTEDTYRLRVGEYRIVYNIFDSKLVIEIIRVRNRKEAYR